jgi:uncharacterized protein YukJ
MRANCEEGEAVPLETPYVVIIGTLQSADLQNPSGGQWPHYHVHVQAGATVYDSAINLKSLTNIQIEYRVRSFFDSSVFANIVALPDGLHPLAQNPFSGALDYVRHQGITGESGWILQNGDNLIQVSRAQLTNVQRLYIFGAEYATGDGVHDVHMNQGDPNGSEFQHLDGIWQDGGVIFQYGPPQPRLDILQIKFETQSLHTDNHGHPIQSPTLRPYYAYIPRWWWPPGDPWSDIDRAALVEQELVELAFWAAAIPELSEGTAKTAMQGLKAELAQRLPTANDEELTRSVDYAIKLGRSILAHSIRATIDRQR